MISHTLPQKGKACNSSPAESSTPASKFTNLDALALGMGHDLGKMLDALRDFGRDVEQALGVHTWTLPDKTCEKYQHMVVRRAALVAVEQQLDSIDSAIKALVCIVKVAANADRLTRHLEDEYAADKELAAARRKRRRIASPRAR